MGCVVSPFSGLLCTVAMVRNHCFERYAMRAKKKRKKTESANIITVSEESAYTRKGGPRVKQEEWDYPKTTHGYGIVVRTCHCTSKSTRFGMHSPLTRSCKRLHGPMHSIHLQKCKRKRSFQEFREVVGANGIDNLDGAVVKAVSQRLSTAPGCPNGYGVFCFLFVCRCSFLGPPFPLCVSKCVDTLTPTGRQGVCLVFLICDHTIPLYHPSHSPYPSTLPCFCIIGR